MKYVNFIMDASAGCRPQMPTKKYTGDAGWDLFASRPASIPPNSTMDIHTDVRLNLPTAIFARIVGRSSTLRTHNLMVNEGIIDNGYTGELFICIRNMSPDIPFAVVPGMRLAQILFHQIEDIRWAEVSESNFRGSNRGDRGFGSTGLFEIKEG